MDPASIQVYFEILDGILTMISKLGASPEDVAAMREKLQGLDPLYVERIKRADADAGLPPDPKLEG